MSLYPESDESTATNPWRIRYGFVACIVVTTLLWVIACNPIFVQGCTEGDPRFAAWCAGVIEIALIVLLFVRRGGWRFTAGFFLSFLVLATCSRGRATPSWLVAPAAALAKAAPLWSPVIARQNATAAQQEWIGVHRTQHPTLVHATRLVNLVHECAAAVRDSSSAGYPRSVAELSAPLNCRALRSLALDAEGVTSRFGDTDNGWRMVYRPAEPNADGTVTGYTVRVLEDPRLERPSPVFSGDESGIIREQAPGAPPRLAASPVASLVMLRRCLTRVPAEKARLEAQRGWPSPTPALHLVGSVCPELSQHIGTPYHNGPPESGMVAVQVHDQPGEFTDTAAVYRSEFVPADVDGLIFELHLTPMSVTNPAIHAGSRRFFVSRTNAAAPTSPALAFSTIAFITAFISSRVTARCT